jgi:type IV pilus assembly protein PilV
MSARSGEQHGVGMVEVLVALLVMSIGVLGYAGLQLRALNSSGDAFIRSQAMAIAQDAVERIAANRSGVATYSTAANWPAQVQGEKPGNWTECMDALCGSAQMAQWDIDQLAWMAGDLLPGGRIDAVACQASSALCVRVAWNNDAPLDCESAAGVVNSRDCVVLEVVP